VRAKRAKVPKAKTIPPVVPKKGQGRAKLARRSLTDASRKLRKPVGIFEKHLPRDGSEPTEHQAMLQSVEDEFWFRLLAHMRGQPTDVWDEVWGPWDAKDDEILDTMLGRASKKAAKGSPAPARGGGRKK
jgi:hypothetical protein